jgi:hypothetical protein
MSNHDRYAALAAEGRLTLAEGFELTQAFPDPKPQDENFIQILDLAKFADVESELLMSGYRHRQFNIGVHSFTRGIDRSHKLFTIDRLAITKWPPQPKA